MDIFRLVRIIGLMMATCIILFAHACKPRRTTIDSMRTNKPSVNSTKYQIGMDMDEVKSIIPGDPKVWTAALAPRLSSGGFSEDEKQMEPFYMIKVIEENVVLYFNYNKKLIKIVRLELENNKNNGEGQ